MNSMSEQIAFVIVSGILFGIVALLHALRLALRWKVRINARELPIWFSALGFVASAGLSAWAFWLLL